MDKFLLNLSILKPSGTLLIMSHVHVAVLCDAKGRRCKFIDIFFLHLSTNYRKKKEDIRSKG